MSKRCEQFIRVLLPPEEALRNGARSCDVVEIELGLPYMLWIAAWVLLLNNAYY